MKTAFLINSCAWLVLFGVAIGRGQDWGALPVIMLGVTMSAFIFEEAE